MKILKNMAFVLGVGYIAFMVGMAFHAIGTMPKIPLEPFPAWLPLMMAAVLICPFILGIIAGKDGDV